MLQVAILISLELAIELMLFIATCLFYTVLEGFAFMKVVEGRLRSNTPLLYMTGLC